MKKEKIKVGCCGFAEARRKYFKEFRCVEIQKTFYQLPRIETAYKWREEAPQGFIYTMKAWQLITHEATSPTYRRLTEKIPDAMKSDVGSFKPTQAVMEALKRTVEFAEAVGAAVIVFQCPASFTESNENVRNLERFLTRLPRGKFEYAWEPRGNWKHDTISRICKDYDIIHCVDPFVAKALYGKFLYLRLHGVSGYRYSYTDADLRFLKGLVANKVGFMLFNNVTMLDDARRFQRLISS